MEEEIEIQNKPIANGNIELVITPPKEKTKARWSYK